MRAIRALLPEGVRVKRDRGPGVFVSKHPVDSPYFRREPIGELWRLFPAQPLFDEFERGEPEDALMRSLLRFRGIPADEASVALFSEALKLREAPEPARIEALDRAIRRRAAWCLRAGGGGGLYACAAALIKIGGDGHEA